MCVLFVRVLEIFGLLFIATSGHTAQLTTHYISSPDTTWTWDVIFAEVSGDLQKEWFPDQEEPQKEGKAAIERPYTAFNRFPV